MSERERERERADTKCLTRERELSLNTAVTPYKSQSISLRIRPVGGEPIKAGT